MPKHLANASINCTWSGGPRLGLARQRGIV
jgi:hypothetical protein